MRPFAGQARLLAGFPGEGCRLAGKRTYHSQGHVSMAASDPAIPASTGGHLLRILGLAFGLAVMVGMTIGMGILRTPGEIAALVPSTSIFLLTWVLGAAYAILGP